MVGMGTGPECFMILKCYENLRSNFANSVINWKCITKVMCRFHCICPFSEKDVDEGWGQSSGGIVPAWHGPSTAFMPALL